MTDDEFVNVTIKAKVRKSTFQSNPHWAIYDVIRNAVAFGNPATRYLSQEATNAIVESVAKSLNLDPWDEFEEDQDALVIDHLTGVRNAVAKLLQFVPEGGYTDSLAKDGFAHDNVGFFASEQEYRDYLDGKGEGQKDYPPIFSDPVMYALFASGKHDGRTFRAYVNEIKRLVGITDED